MSVVVCVLIHVIVALFVGENDCDRVGELVCETIDCDGDCGGDDDGRSSSRRSKFLARAACGGDGGGGETCGRGDCGDDGDGVRVNVRRCLPRPGLGCPGPAWWRPGRGPAWFSKC